MDHEFHSAEERRAAIVALTEKETGIDEAMIETPIRAFYARVRQDALLAPVFESRIAEWEPHLDNMFAFWSSLTLHTGPYHGRPMAKHMPLLVDSRHFDRWLALFEQTARDVCAPAAKNDLSSARAGSRRAWSLASRALAVFFCTKASAICARR
jgi:hemoglobin